MKKHAFLVATFALVGCADKGTFVVLDFTSGPTKPAKSIHCSLTLDGKSADATFTAKGDAFSFATSGSLQIQSGSGPLAVQCEARDASATPVGSVSGSVTVVRDQTVTLSLAFSSGGTDLGVDAMTDAGAPSLAIAPGMHDFGVVLSGSSSPSFAYTVTNSGTAPTTALVVTLDGTDAADFTVDGSACTGKVLAPAESCIVNATFTPATATAPDSKSATLHVGTADGTTASATLAGEAGAAGALSFSDSMHDFGGQLEGATGPDTTFTLSNTGTTPTTTITTKVSGSDSTAFVIGQDNCNGQVLAGGATCTVTVHLAPTTRGALTATLSATADTGGTAVIALSGAGQIAATLTIVSATTAAMPFALGTVDIGTTGSTKYSFTVRNDGDFVSGALTTAITAGSGATMSELSYTGNTTCAQPLDPAATCIVEVAFKPGTYGVKDYTLTVSASPGGSVSTYASGGGRDYVTVDVETTGTGTITDGATPSDYDCTGGATGCTATFARDTTVPTVALLATPGTNFGFGGWTDPTGTGAPACADVTSTTCTISLASATGFATQALAQASPYAFTAEFDMNAAQMVTITYVRKELGRDTASPTSLGTISSDQGFSCTSPTCGTTTTEQVAVGTVVTVTAAGAAVTGGTSLRRIGGACTAASTSAADISCMFTASAATTVNVLFSGHDFAFVSTTAFTSGDLGGLAGADIKCAADATAAHLPGTYTAWLSSSTVDAKSRVGTGGFIRPDGRLFSTSLADLVGGGVYYPLTVDAAGGAHANDTVFTGTNADGTATGGAPCTDWTDATPAGSDAITTGQTDGGSGAWTAFGTSSSSACSGVSFRLYCLGGSITGAADAPSVGSNRQAFVSSTLFTPAATMTIADLDAICTTDGAAVSGTHTWHAFAATSAATAASRFSGKTLWARPDGTLVASTVANALAGTLLAPLDVHADGSRIGTSTPVWTGATSPSATGSTSCGDWGSTSGTGTAGRTDDISGFFSSDTPACTTAAAVYCFEQ